MSDVMEMSEHRKSTLCGQWLHWCMDHGWKKSDIQGMADLFWKYEGWKTFAGYRP